MVRRPPRSALFPCTTLFRSRRRRSSSSSRSPTARGARSARSLRGRRGSRDSPSTAGGWPSARTRPGPTGTSSGSPTSRDRKSTRLNSSHANISHVVFCLKKKTVQLPLPSEYDLHPRLAAAFDLDRDLVRAPPLHRLFHAGPSPIVEPRAFLLDGVGDVIS